MMNLKSKGNIRKDLREQFNQLVTDITSGKVCACSSNWQQRCAVPVAQQRCAVPVAQQRCAVR
jgi:hypothetical protein